MVDVPVCICAGLYQHPQVRTAACSELSSVPPGLADTKHACFMLNMLGVYTCDAAHAEADSTQAATLLL